MSNENSEPEPQSLAPVDDAVRTRVTTLVTERHGRGRADELTPLVYDELRRLASVYMSRERRGHTLEPTELVHEAYLRLVDQDRIDWQRRTHFLAVGANVMRRVLVDHARRKGRAKRGGNWQRVTLLDCPAADGLDRDEMLGLEEALEKMAQLDERQADIVELRYFGGLSAKEIAALLKVSKRTVEGELAHARAWLLEELSSSVSD